MPGALNSRLQFAHRHSGQKQLFFLLLVEPSYYATVRTWFSQFRNNIRIQEVPVHLNSGTARRFNLCRSGIKFSKRASGANSKALRLGRAARCRRFHSSIGTRTAVSIPRRVTIWGPFLIVASRNSLKRAFASCTCQEPMLISLVLVYFIYYITSHMTSQYISGMSAFRYPARLDTAGASTSPKLSAVAANVAITSPYQPLARISESANCRCASFFCCA